MIIVRCDCRKILLFLRIGIIFSIIFLTAAAMDNFRIGERVEVLDETISGLVQKVEGDRITLITDQGFPMQYYARELIRMGGSISVSNRQVGQVKKEKEGLRRKTPPRVKPKQRQAPKMEVDLHIGQLLPSTKGMGNHDILNVQLETAKRQLEFAMANRIQKVVFIHGVGEGVLKEELHYLFGRYDNLEHYDADYQKYGLGATEVYIFQNP